MKKTQLELLKKQKSAYGGSLYTTREGRKRTRPLAVRNTIHLVLRSSKAKGAWSLKNPKHEPEIRRIVKKFAGRFGVRVLSLAVVGNHLHFQIKLSNRFLYTPFIRAIGSAIAMAVTGINRWSKASTKQTILPDKQASQVAPKTAKRLSFWDGRPFTRVVESFQGFLNLRNYIQLNYIEGYGYKRDEARFILEHCKLEWGIGVRQNRAMTGMR